MAYCVKADLEAAVGGASVLIQLLDKDGDGVADAALVTAAIGRSTADVASAIQIQLDLTALDANAYPDALVYNSADIAAYYAWLIGGEGQVMPDAIIKRYENAQKWLDQVAKRERTLGSVPKPTSGQLCEQVDRNPSDGTVPRTPTWRSTAGSFW